MRPNFTAFMVTVGLCLIFTGTSLAASTQTLSTGVSLWRGTSKLSDSMNRVVDPATGVLTALTPENCPGIRDRIIQKDALTRTTGTATYRCQVDLRAIVTFQANQTCSPPRAPVTRQTACPNDPTRTFTQTQTWTIAPYPTCEVAGAWLPATPPADACPPTQLPAPTGVSTTTISASEIKVQWNVVPDAVAYSLRRCIGGTCEPLDRTPLLCTQILEARHTTLSAGLTVSYRVIASRTADCSTQLGIPSAIVTGTTATTATVTDLVVPRACASRVCDVSWTPEGAADGFRIFYSRTDGIWANAPVQVAGSVTRTNVTMPETGIWYFAVKAFIGGTESPLSNVVVRDVQ
jgi:hypothetical protein